MTDIDVVEELRQLRLSVTRQFDEGPAAFWWEIIDLARHEFTTRVEQTLRGKEFEGLVLQYLMDIALRDYIEYWKDRVE